MNDNQGREDQKQFPECHGIVWAAIIGSLMWLALLTLASASQAV